jgi:murein DD-endopeptidase MepM/ murein hydrolase activator NlpD
LSSPSRRARHAAPARTRSSVAAPAVLLVALAGPLAGLTVAASASSVVAAPAARDDRQVSLVALAASRSGPERAARSRDASPGSEAAAVPEVEPAVEPAPEPAPAEPPAEPAPVAARPSDGLLTSAFGPRWGRMHAGVDFATGLGAPVRAAAEGTVATAGAEGGYGLTVRVHHADGAETVYAHLSSIEVAPGQPVGVGQDLGREGSTGRSTGPHLHFEVRYGGAPVDPATWLTDRGIHL